RSTTGRRRSPTRSPTSTSSATTCCRSNHATPWCRSSDGDVGRPSPPVRPPAILAAGRAGPHPRPDDRALGRDGLPILYDVSPVDHDLSPGVLVPARSDPEPAVPRKLFRGAGAAAFPHLFADLARRRPGDPPRKFDRLLARRLRLRPPAVPRPRPDLLGLPGD